MLSYDMEGGSHSGADSQIQFTPLNLIRGGRYEYSFGNVDGRNDNGYFWIGHSYSIVGARSLYFYSTMIRPQNNFFSIGYGFPLRCLGR